MQKAYSERADLTRSGVSMLVQMYKHLCNIYKFYVKFYYTLNTASNTLASIPASPQ